MSPVSWVYVMASVACFLIATVLYYTRPRPTRRPAPVDIDPRRLRALEADVRRPIEDVIREAEDAVERDERDAEAMMLLHPYPSQYGGHGFEITSANFTVVGCLADSCSAAVDTSTVLHAPTGLAVPVVNPAKSLADEFNALRNARQRQVWWHQQQDDIRALCLDSPTIDRED